MHGQASELIMSGNSQDLSPVNQREQVLMSPLPHKKIRSNVDLASIGLSCLWKLISPHASCFKSRAKPPLVLHFIIKRTEIRNLVRTVLFFHCRNTSKKERDCWPAYKWTPSLATGSRHCYVIQPAKKIHIRQNSSPFRNRKISSKWYIFGLFPVIVT